MITRTGTAANETLMGSIGNDFLDGGAGNDVLYGGESSNWMAVSANDTMNGGDGNDILYGGDGNDTFIFSAGRDQYYGGDGIDQVSFAAATSSIELTINGFGAFNRGAATGNVVDRIEIVTGTGFSDIIFADRLLAATVYGGNGNDRLTGGDAADRLFGDAGNDLIYGNGGVDTLAGGIGHDSLYGGDASDRLVGASGNDFLYGGTGHDRLEGGAGVDRMFGEAGNDILTGGTGLDDFVFLYDVAAPVASRDVIADFDALAGERIMLTNSAQYDSFAEVMAASRMEVADTIISLFGRVDIVLKDVAMTELTAQNFTF